MVYLRIPQRLCQHHVGPTGLGCNELLVHGSDGRAKLAPNRSAAAPAFHLVASQTPAKPKRSRTIDENCKVEQTPNRRPQEQPKSLNEDQRLGLPAVAVQGPGVRFEIVARHVTNVSRAAVLEELFHTRPVDGVRMVV